MYTYKYIYIYTYIISTDDVIYIGNNFTHNNTNDMWSKPNAKCVFTNTTVLFRLLGCKIAMDALIIYDVMQHGTMCVQSMSTGLAVRLKALTPFVCIARVKSLHMLSCDACAYVRVRPVAGGCGQSGNVHLLRCCEYAALWGVCHWSDGDEQR